MQGRKAERVFRPASAQDQACSNRCSLPSRPCMTASLGEEFDTTNEESEHTEHRGTEREACSTWYAGCDETERSN